MLDKANKVAIRKALKRRVDEYRSQLETITGKAIRRQLEVDLSLPAKSLDVSKAEIDELINAIVLPVEDATHAGQAPGDDKENQQHIAAAAGCVKPDSAKPSKADKQHKPGKPETAPVDKTLPAKEAAPPSHQPLKPAAQAAAHPPARSQPKKKSEPSKAGKASRAAKKARRAVESESDGGSDSSAAGSSDDAQSDDVASGADSEEEEDGHRGRGKAAARKAAGAAKPAAAGRKYGAAVEKMQAICKAATIKISPAVYKGGQAAGVEAALSALLAKHGLSATSSDGAITRVRQKLSKERELDGIDTSNIIAEAGRPRRAAAAVNYKALYSYANDDDEEEQDEEQQVAAPRRQRPAKGSDPAHPKSGAPADEAASGSDLEEGKAGAGKGVQRKGNGKAAAPARRGAGSASGSEQSGSDSAGTSDGSEPSSGGDDSGSEEASSPDDSEEEVEHIGTKASSGKANSTKRPRKVALDSDDD